MGIINFSFLNGIFKYHNIILLYMARTIIVSDGTYTELDALRQKINEKKYESFNIMLIRLLPQMKKVSK